MLALRLGIGTVWAINCLFVFDPANQFFPTFGTTAASFESSSLGGTGFPAFVAANPQFFSILIAATTLYLAAAFLLGFTTRWACWIGAAFALGLLVSQWGQTFFIPGGTDVGPMPIYVAVYIALWAGHANRHYSLDALLARRLARRAAAAPVTTAETA
jgi:uncharacterized membrane protein YphA (DoxX/SURF4 family)